MWILAILVLAAAGTAGGLMLYGRERLWTDLAGPADLGPYDFDLPVRTGRPNDSLACPADDAACAAAAPELVTPHFAASADDLYAAARSALEALPRTTVIEERPEEGTLRAVVRSRLFAFPDTVWVRVRRAAPMESRLWIYSRSQIGHSDLGANDTRVSRLVRRIARDLPTAPAPPPLIPRP